MKNSSEAKICSSLSLLKKKKNQESGKCRTNVKTEMFSFLQSRAEAVTVPDGCFYCMCFLRLFPVLLLCGFSFFGLVGAHMTLI